MMHVQPYLFFDGRCEEALELYGKTIGAEVMMLRRFKDSPDPPPPGMLPAGFEHKVMHASVRIGDSMVMASDGHCAGKPEFKGFSLSITVADEATADRIFTALGENGHVVMPIGKTFWSPRFGMLTDRFGVSWMIGVAAPAVTMFTTPSDRELVATRVVDAPRRVVWDMWTSPNHVPHWMLGPEGWTMPVCEIDLRPGGGWHHVWRQPDGATMEMRGTYREVAAPERLVTTEAWGGDWPETVNTLVLTEHGGKTTMTCTVRYVSKEARERALGTGMKDGWAKSYERLDAYLRRQPACAAAAP
jgi:uncharacterized glyoxalase superfamily protein PhnB/uncharacterized protein YndB with AHSA1/START domain